MSLRPAHLIQLAVLALLGLGVVMATSAGLSVPDATATTEPAPADPFAPDAADPPPSPPDAWAVAPLDGVYRVLTSRQAIYAGLAVAVMLLAGRINVRELFRAHGVSNPLILMVLGALALAAMTFVPGMGRSVNGAARWLYLGPKLWGLSFQPSELVKWVMVLALAWWCARRAGVMHRFGAGLLPPLMLLAVACGLIVIEDLGTAALIGTVGGLLLIAGGARLWQLALLVPPALGAFVAAIAANPYRVARLTAFLDPWADPRGTGYHPIQSMLAIVHGGLTGRGLGHGVQKFGYLPEDTTDFIFSIICEELGLVGAATVVGLYLAILWVGLGIVRDCRDTFARLVGLGVLLTVGLQAAINLAVVTVVVPTKGIALPLVSAGGTGWIMTAFALGLLAALDNANHLEREAGLELDPRSRREPATPTVVPRRASPRPA